MSNKSNTGDDFSDVSHKNSLPGLCVRRPLLAAVMNLMIIIAGLAALLAIEVRELPDIDRPIVSVRAVYPGASPTTVDAEVTALVEGAIATVSGVVNITSSSEEGNFRMRVEFNSNRDLADASNDVREAVSRITPRLPGGVEDLFVVKAEQNASPVMQIAVWSENNTIDVLTRRVTNEIIPEFTAIDGVADVVVFGDRDRVIRVALAPERLSAFGLSVGDVVDVLRAAQFDIPVGSFSAGQMDVLVRADASVIQPDRIEKLMVRDPVRLGDLGDVYFSLAKAESVARLDKRMVLNLGIIRQAQSNTVSISDDVQKAVLQLQERFPELRFATTSDDAVFIRGAIKEVLTSLILSLLIVVMVIWVFFGRIGPTLIPIIAIPVSLVGSLAAIWLLGFSINLITLLSLVLATGLVVDDAIVVTENIERRRAEGFGARAAAVIGTRQVFFAVIATTITLMAVFLPISFLPSDAGRLFTEFGYVLAITVAISSFVALTICPMIASKLSTLGGHNSLTNSVGGAIRNGYAVLLKPVLAAPMIAITSAVLIASSSAIIYAKVGQELVPPEDRGRVTVWIQGPDGTGLNYTDRQVEQVEAMLEPWLEKGVAENIYSITGRYDLNRGEIAARLIPWNEREITQSEIEADISSKLSLLAGAQGRIRSDNSLNLRGSSGGGLSIALTGASYPEIAEAADAFAKEMESIQGLSGVRVQYQATQPQLSIQIDRAKAADLDVPMSELSATLGALIDEDEVTELTIADESVPIILQSQSGAVRNPSDLLNLRVRSRAGELIPLYQLVNFSEQGVAAELDRQGQRRAVEIDASLSPELGLGVAVEKVRELSREKLPDGIGLLLLGEAQSLDETSSALMLTFVIALVVIFLVLVAQFESITSAAIIMITVPFGVSAAIFALWITGISINIYSQIGILLLIGIMAKNGILLVEFADQLREKGRSVAQAAFEAATLRLRAISMTLASTVFAGLPLILSTGPGAEARASIGWVVFGGLGLAAFFTLFLTPAVYTMIAGLSKHRSSEEAKLEAEIKTLRELTDK